MDSVEISGIRITFQDLGEYARKYDSEVNNHRETIRLLAALKSGDVSLDQVTVDAEQFTWSRAAVSSGEL